MASAINARGLAIKACGLEIIRPRELEISASYFDTLTVFVH